MSDPNTSPSPEEEPNEGDEAVNDVVVGDDRQAAAERAGGPDILPSDSNPNPAGPDSA